MKKLNEYIKELNMINVKIKHNKEFKINLIIILPILHLLKEYDLMNNKEMKMILNNESLKIKEIRYWKFSDFNRVSEKIDEYLSNFTNETIQLLPPEIDAQSVDFLLYEILINVYKHSKFKNAYLQIITHDNENIDICIFDNGIGIPKSFEESSIEFINDSEAIFDAINGKTTDKEKYGLHGRGLNSATRITTLGFDGEMLIASGFGVCVVSSKGANTYSNSHEIKGTFVILRIKNKKVNNLYEYLKFNKIKKIKED